MQSTHSAAANRELHHAINPTLADFDRQFRRQTPAPISGPSGSDREAFAARARAIIAVTLKGGC